MRERLTERDIFNELLTLGQNSAARDGAVTAALVRDDTILFSAASINSGVIIHGEHNVLGYAYKANTLVLPEDTLYTTLEPCSGKFDSSIFIPDCTSMIIWSGVKNVIYAASDPIQTPLTHKRFEAAGVKIKQTKEQDIIEQSRELFNRKITGYRV